MAHVAIDWNKYMEGLAGKANLALNNCPANIDFVIESRINDNGTWYRLYKSGWLEQGGVFKIPTSGSGTLIFPKPFQSGNDGYSLVLGKQSSDSSTWTTMTYNKSTTSVTLKVNLTGYTISCDWYACGAGANFSHEGVLPSDPSLDDILG